MFLELAELNRDPRNGMLGIDLRIVPREKGDSAALCEAGRMREVALLNVWNVRRIFGNEGKRMSFPDEYIDGAQVGWVFKWRD